MDEPRIPVKVKGAVSRFKGLPPWAYVAAVGVGGAAIWFGIRRSNSAAVADAADVTGDYGGTLSATTSGDAYPTGSQGAGYYYDPTTGGQGTVEQTGNNGIDWDHFMELLQVLPTGGGTQSSAAPEDHYTPPAITINIPESAIPQPMTQPAPAAPAPAAPVKSASPAKDPCVGEYPYLQDNGPNKGKCYKVALKNGKRYNRYKGGPDWVPA